MVAADMVGASARRSLPRSATAPGCWRSAAAISSSVTATSSARRSCPGSASPTSRRSASRETPIGNVAIEIDLGGEARLLAGFENHGGRTYLGADAQPLGRVVKGFGNNGEDGLEGVRRDNLIGTYLHGPLLPKNAWLADHLTALALERRYGSPPQLEPLRRPPRAARAAVRPRGRSGG